MLAMLAIIFARLVEFGWAVELLSRQLTIAVGWMRLIRWLCALLGTLLAVLSLLLGLTPILWIGVVIAVTGVLLVFEMAPSGPVAHPWSWNTLSPRGD